MKKTELRQNELGIWLEEEVEFEKRERMTRKEWKVWFAIEEITEDEFRKEMAEFQWPLDDRIG